MAIRPGKGFANLATRGPSKAARELGNVVTLHEAIIVCMIRQNEFTMSLRKLVKLNRQYELYRRENDGEFPDFKQIGARARMPDYAYLFRIDGGSLDRAKVSLRRFGDSPALEE